MPVFASASFPETSTVSGSQNVLFLSSSVNTCLIIDSKHRPDYTVTFLYVASHSIPHQSLCKSKKSNQHYTFSQRLIQATNLHRLDSLQTMFRYSDKLLFLLLVTDSQGHIQILQFFHSSLTPQLSFHW